MTKVVLDTNVIISSIFWRGNPYRLLRMDIEKKYTMVTSPAITAEVSYTLKEKFKVPDTKVDEFLRILSTFSETVEPRTKMNLIKADESDNKIIECAIESKADYVVSGDAHLLEMKEYRGIKILTPHELLKVLKY